MRINNFLDKPILNMNAEDLANMANRAARLSNTYALNLMKAGIRGDVTSKDAIKMSRIGRVSMFDNEGNLSEAGRENLMKALKSIFQTDSNKKAGRITIGRYLNNMLSDGFLMQDKMLEREKASVVIKNIDKLA